MAGRRNIKQSLPPEQHAAFAELQEMPNIGPAMAEDLLRLGIRRKADLKSRDPMQMYEAISRMDGVRHDPCVLDTYMAAVDYAKTGRAKPWWSFTARRKKLMAEMDGVGRERRAKKK